MTDPSPVPGRANDTAGWNTPDGMAALLEVVEPRCRICRDPLVRRRVNELLDWRDLSNVLQRWATSSPELVPARSVTCRSVLASLSDINEGLEERDRISYSVLWVHAKRHHEADGFLAHWATKLDKELRRGLGRFRGQHGPQGRPS